MKNMRKALLAAATATAVTLSGTAVANAGDLSDSSSSSSEGSVSSLERNTPAGAADDTTGTPATDGEKDTSGSSDFADVFGSSGKDGNFSFAQALKAMKNVAAFGTAVAGVLGVILTLSTKLPQVLELFGIDTPSKK